MSDENISLSDFRSWLQGVEDMQADDWVPNSIQWKKIRQKINQIEEVEIPSRVAPQYTAPQQFVPPPSYPVPRPMAEMPVMVPPGPSALEVPGGPRVSTFVPPQIPRLDNTKTPDIDTSNGQYTTNFT